MITLGVDADTFNTGMAAVVHMGGTDWEVVWVRSIAVDPKRGVEWRLVQQVKGIADALRELADIIIPSRVAVETMRDYGLKSKVRPQDLIHLNEVSGAALGAARALWPDALIWDPKPSAWKGTMSKPVHQRRTLKAVGLTQSLLGVNGAEGMTDVQKGHVIDGIGLALKVATHHFPGSLR